MKKIETKVIFRCSGLGKIMTSPQGKTNAQKYADALESLAKAEAELEKCSATALKTREKLEAKIPKLKAEIVELEKVKDEILLSKTCRDYLKTMAIEIRYNRKKRIVNKYVKKGLAVEEQSIELYSEFKGEALDNNKERLENEFFTGETDLNWLDSLGQVSKVTDIKSSYDIDSFEDNRDEDAKKDNRLQLLGYCDLHNCQSASVANVLTNNDYSLIMDEIRRETFNVKADELEGFEVPLKRVIEIAKDNIFDYVSFCEFLTDQYGSEIVRILAKGEHSNEEAQEMFNSFVEVELQDRVIEIEIDRDEDEINAIKERIKDCRKYLANKYNIHHVEG
jgi:hypothetical protein